jgi:hypothetical protein
MLGLLVAVVMSHLARLDFGLARYWGMDFARVVLYYLLLVAVVDSPGRLRTFLIWLLMFITTMTVLALCQYYGFVNIPMLKVLERLEEDPATGELITILQLVGTGIFNDPNDFSLILALGCLISLYLANDRQFGLVRLLWLFLLGGLLYAILLTQSRGGLLALAAGLLTYLANRIGARRAVIAAAIGVPLALPLLGGRLARMSTQADTAQERMHLWRDSLDRFRGSPLFGIGANTLHDEIGLVAHNSYVHCYAEVGFLGGTCFLGTFFFAVLILQRPGRSGRGMDDAEMKRLRPYLLAMLATLGVSLYSLTRCYVASTYVPIAIIEAYQGIAVVGTAASRVSLNSRLVSVLCLMSVGCVVGISLFVRVFVN